MLGGEEGGPSEAQAEPAESDAPTSAAGKKRLLLLGLGTLAVVGGLSFLGYQVYARVQAERDREVETLVRTEFLQAVEMVRARDAFAGVEGPVAELEPTERAGLRDGIDELGEHAPGLGLVEVGVDAVHVAGPHDEPREPELARGPGGDGLAARVAVLGPGGDLEAVTAGRGAHRRRA